MVVEAATKDRLDEVDIFLASQSGEVERGRDPLKCHHNTRQKCSHCLPIDPFDEEYLKSKDIKHMSFHSYLRKLTAGHGRGNQLKQPLESLNCLVNLNCSGGHKPYPGGVCAKCRPSNITLARQKYRHVDNVQVENEHVVNDFIEFWRKSAHQRVGYLIGKYQPMNDVPLGIRAVVAAIYEPPQTTTEASVSLLEDPHAESVDRLCSWLGLKRVGWIFTDLWAANPSQGTVHCTRHKDAFLLSAEECITAAWLQNQYPNVTPYSSTGIFGSKFATMVASGNEGNNIDFHGYQVSNQCAALVEAELLCPTSHPELAYVREQPLRETQYIIDVQYTEKNEYGAEVRRDGRPLPVEYLLVDVPCGVPKEPQSTFHRGFNTRFHIENRQAIGEIQDGANLSAYVNDFTLNQFLELATNFHFLLFLLTNDIIKFTDDDVRELCEAVKTQDRGRAMEWARTNAAWSHLAAQAAAQDTHDRPSTSRGAGPSHQVDEWSCAHCTFMNMMSSPDCSMCGLPRN